MDLKSCAGDNNEYNAKNNKKDGQHFGSVLGGEWVERSMYSEARRVYWRCVAMTHTNYVTIISFILFSLLIIALQ